MWACYREPDCLLSTGPVNANYFYVKINLLRPVHTVAEKCDCRRCLAVICDSRIFLRQSHFSATVYGQGFTCCVCLLRTTVLINIFWIFCVEGSTEPHSLASRHHHQLQRRQQRRRRWCLFIRRITSALPRSTPNRQRNRASNCTHSDDAEKISLHRLRYISIK